MTSEKGVPASEASLDVPTAAVLTNRADRRRAYAATAAVVLVVGMAIGLSALAGRSGAGVDSRPRETATPAAAATAAPITGRPPASPPGPTVQRLLEAENIALPGAGRLLLATRRDTAANILAWSPGDGEVALERRFPNAFSRVGLPQLTSLAPDGRSLVVFTIADFDEAGRDEVVLFDEGGHRAWAYTGVTGLSLAVWSDDSSRLAVLGGRGTWILAVRDGSTYAERVVDVPDEAASDLPAPVPPYDERIQPVGFSADGAWVYGAHQSVARGIGAPFIRASTTTGVVEEIASLPALGGPGPFRDGSGRSIGFTLDASTPGGPPSLAVLEADRSVAYRIQTDQLMGLAFAADGTLLVLEGEGFDLAGRVRLVAYDRTGPPGQPLLDVGPVTSATLAGAQGGYAAVVIATTSPERAAQVIVIRLGDRRVSAVGMPADDASALVGTSWLAEP